ncbi:hypothetical protein HNY73_013047 [Argiope bruennichi]|uniref:Uncharacterized protein n=1 Tax=Argiope bruennichi TaxID=94029 RepID=A0A8T0F1E7_ARGBR|nr:hypothetical protein HNY73_013047 [Argiope bruennichi]
MFCASQYERSQKCMIFSFGREYWNNLLQVNLGNSEWKSENYHFTKIAFCNATHRLAEKNGRRCLVQRNRNAARGHPHYF